MKQVVLTSAYTFSYQDVPIPVPHDDQVLLHVQQMGICASDIQMYHGLHKYMKYPVVIGHEVAATIAQLGDHVCGYSVGDQVTVEPQVYCGTCLPCRIGRYNVCERLKVLGVHRDGFCAEYVAVDAGCLHSVEGLTQDQAALIEPLAVGFGAASRAGDLTHKKVVVVGAGTIGNLVAQAAQALEAEDVMITDIKQKKLDFSKKCGIGTCINTTNIELKDAILEHFGPDRADIIIDCAATRESIQSILAAARPSSAIVETGNFKAPVEMEMPLLQRQEISLLGHMMYVQKDFENAICAVRKGRVCLDGFATQYYGIDQLSNAFQFIDKNPDDVIKCMIHVAQ